MPISYHTGDLFDSGADILVNPVNCVGVMGKGLAKQFKQRYPRMFRKYKSFCEYGWLQIGTVKIWAERDHTPPYIACFPTKEHWRDPSQLEWIEVGLDELRRKLRLMNNRYHFLDKPPASIAIPPLGCGLGGLKWTEVRPLIEEHLGDLPNEIMVYGPKPAEKE